MSMTVPALRIKQNKHTLYMFTIDGKLIPSITTVPHLEMGEDGIRGFQRQEVASHVANIRSYLDGDNPLLPNSLIVGFENRPKFRAIEEGSDLGMLTISRKGVMVDGQQRAAALRESSVEEGTFPVPVVAFVAEDASEMTDHFMRVNMSKPLSKDLLNTLLPGVTSTLTPGLERNRVPAAIIARLSEDEDSPLRSDIETPVNRGGSIKYSTMMRMIEESMDSDLFVQHREDGNLDGMVSVLKEFWRAVQVVFADAWQGPKTKKSRLLMAAGVISLGKLMVEMVNSGLVTKGDFEDGLRIVAPHCRWTETDQQWNFGSDGKCRWDAIENTSKTISKLGSALCRWYRKGLKVSEAA